MFCTHCGAKNTDTAQFCISCGAALNNADHSSGTPATPPPPQQPPAAPTVPAAPAASEAMHAPASAQPTTAQTTTVQQAHQGLRQQPLWAIIVAVVCLIETVLLIWMLAAKPAQSGNKKNLEGAVNLFSLAAEGISAANDYSFRASAKAEGNTVVITVKFPSVIYDRGSSSSNEWAVCDANNSDECHTITEADLDAYNNMIAKDYIRKIQNDFRQMTGIPNLGFTVKLLDKNGTLIETVPIDKYLDGSILQ